MKLLIIGLSNITHLGEAFFKVAKNLNLESKLINSSLAYQAPKLIKQINWHLREKYPSRLNSFSQNVLQKCIDFQPYWILTTGIAPVNAQVLQKIGDLGIKRINFLTDDPWNRAHYPPWFFKCLSHYDVIFTPRRGNINDLTEMGCKDVRYLSFGYDPDLFYPEILTSIEQQKYQADVVFAGGADNDRVPYINALIKSGINLALYGSYWEKYPETKAYNLGHADIPTLRSAIVGAKISLCLVRRANRDGNCMRTFEVPAIGGCMLTEDTQEHREIFGKEGDAVLYFKTISEMLEKTRWLLDHDQERQRLAKNAHLLITQGHYTYGDRLKTMLEL